MKRYAIIFVVAVVTALTAFGLTRKFHRAGPVDEMTWLRNEFHLSDAQVAAIQKLHADYEPICADHCSRIAEARRRMQALAATDPNFAKAQSDWEALKQECSTATRHHLESVAAAMSPAEGQRYLALITPKLADHQHERPMGLQ